MGIAEFVESQEQEVTQNKLVEEAKRKHRTRAYNLASATMEAVDKYGIGISKELPSIAPIQFTENSDDDCLQTTFIKLENGQEVSLRRRFFEGNAQCCAFELGVRVGEKTGHSMTYAILPSDSEHHLRSIEYPGHDPHKDGYEEIADQEVVNIIEQVCASIGEQTGVPVTA